MVFFLLHRMKIVEENSGWYFYALFLLVNKKSSLGIIPCEPLNGMESLVGNMRRVDTGESMNGGVWKLGGGKTKRGGSKSKMVLWL